MATLDHGKHVVKVLTPEMVNQALAEWLLVKCGVNVDAHCKIETQFSFNRVEKKFLSCRVEVSPL